MGLGACYCALAEKTIRESGFKNQGPDHQPPPAYDRKETAIICYLYYHRALVMDQDPIVLVPQNDLNSRGAT